MRRLTGRRRFLLAAAVAVATGAAVSAVVLPRGAAQGIGHGPAGVLASGHFRTTGWGTYGTASIVRDARGTVKLRLNADFNTQRAPELFVYLATYVDGRRVHRSEVAPLHRAWGRQEYVLRGASERMLRQAVEIVCAKCAKTNGVAQLEPTRRAPA
jgi:hypothetical protein